MVLTFVISALVLGFLGSFHCIGMCGPIALSLPVAHLKGYRKLIGILVYNSGRVLTYTAAGLLFGVVGLSFKFVGWQQWLSIVLGSILIVIFLIQIFPSVKTGRLFSFSKWNQWVTRQLVPLFRKGPRRNLFLIGLLNGMLPCGMVYVALAGAMATGNIMYSSVFMAGFGAGTLPAMIMASYAAGFITAPVRNKIRKALPYMFAVMGVLLILRGLDFHIPLVSPHFNHSQAIICK